MKYNIKVIPKSSKTEIIEPVHRSLGEGEKKDNYLKIKLKAVPEKGRANTELIKFLSKHFKTPKSNINIIKGETGRNKIVEIN